MQLTSAAFAQGSAIPAQFTCDGENTSPEFSWKEAPKETKAFALVIHDPDAPRRDGFAHWVLYNIPPEIATIEPNVPRSGEVKGLGVQGRNDSGAIGYTGPCPPAGTHRYVARLYALRDKLDLPAGATYAELIAEMSNKIIEQAELMGTYARHSQKAA